MSDYHRHVWQWFLDELLWRCMLCQKDVAHLPDRPENQP